jgi:hypothetical protein
MLPIDKYNVYWDAGFLHSGNFELLAQINSYDQFHFKVERLTTGTLFNFQVSSVNAIGEGVLS